MKTTYLVNALQPDGTTVLVETTADHWHEITERNKQLPKTDRRYFIVDIINESGVFDCMIMEAPYKEYLRWHAERSPATRNRVLKRLYQHLSIDAGSLENMPVLSSMEDEVIGNLLIIELRDALSEWNDWAADVLDLYLNDQKREVIGYIMRSCAVSDVTAWRYLQQFKNYVKIFLGM